MFLCSRKVTDWWMSPGTGDEKQDILTESPGGQRQLTQCKHTVNYTAKSSGDELDLLFGAAFRKDCKVALYVTNGDLTPQAKRYVNDREYLRGSSADPSVVPTMEYWNGRRIWERIASNNPLLNKWFSGAAQAHALRNASARLINSAMPDRSVLKSDPKAVVAAFRALNTPFGLTADSWFGSARAVPGAAGTLPLDSPVPALKVQIAATAEGPFDLESALKSASAAVLSSLGAAAGWLHQYVSESTSVFFVHDLRKPIVCEVAAARSYVKVGDEIAEEFAWSFDPGMGFVRSDDGDLSWTHEVTGAEWNVSVEQPVGPQEAYSIALRQQQLTRSASEFRFWRLNFTQRNLELLQALPTVRGMILLQGKEYLLFAVPNGERAGDQLESYCTRNEIPFEVLTEEGRREVLSSIEELPFA
jgi:Restriction endonuclease